MTCTGNCNQGRKCSCMVIIPVEMNQQLAEYADEFFVEPDPLISSPLDFLYDLMVHIVATLALIGTVVAAATLILGAR